MTYLTERQAAGHGAEAAFGPAAGGGGIAERRGAGRGQVDALAMRSTRAHHVGDAEVSEGGSEN